MLTSKDTQLLITLIEQGSCFNSPTLEVLQPLGLWHLSVDHKSIVASQKLIRLRQCSPSSQELTAAIFAMHKPYRVAWSRIVAAHLKDAGSRKDEVTLAEQVSQLGEAAESILTQLDFASLSPTNFSEVESFVFGQSAEHSASYPKLVRALAMVANIPQDTRIVDELGKVGSENHLTAWQANRLIQMPTVDTAFKSTSSYLLTGNVAHIDSGNDARHCLEWLQATPWAYLLAHLVYTQDIWRSEQIAGGFRLEIEPTQAKHFMRPNDVEVIVTTRDDIEVSCGTLAELFLRVLDSLNITLFTELDRTEQIAKLNSALSPVIGFMVEAKIWQFVQGSSKDIPHYQIHPQFESIPNTRLGTIGFARPGQHITAAIREQAEHWAVELSSNAGSYRGSTS
ncbi:hypothetical protein L1D13_06725 [Vibrio tubiashii]|uniref:hypothetical protein n=1 Tax=Vibrio tubiashii TaxID=29498 RepID=UPI001EFC69B5|nr:hypothetical protein [Vibrio tubiashii]MCG9582961.1 hypothetical protein [Vibrio tubiashii]MCG9616555.1 hypothetical protein [Vibrio tubiashii]MCG9686612.1 hypothetical protein [Vibrio tubiashii]